MSSSSIEHAAPHQMRLKEQIKVKLVGCIGATLLRLLASTIRWEVVGAFTPDVHANSEACIGAFWHGRQLMLPFLYHRMKQQGGRARLYTLISRHSDGRMIAAAVRHLEIESVAGSSSRGGSEAALFLIDRLKSGQHVAITPDGPRGPREKLKFGVVKIAQLSGKPVFPISYSARRRWTFRSWDAMILPWPFTRGVFVIGDPIRVKQDADASELERASAQIESALNAVTWIADAHEYR